MKIQLVRTGEGRLAFRMEGPGEDDAPPSVDRGGGGLRGWIERERQAIRRRLQNPRSRPARWMRRAWDWVQEQTHLDEPLLVRLRTAEAIEIHYPADLSPREARAAWCDHLARALRRHLPWLVLNALIAPLTVPLAPLPGPNLVGYWFAYRAVRDSLVVLGVRRARGGRVETTFHGDGDDGAGGGRCAGAVGPTDGTRRPCDS